MKKLIAILVVAFVAMTATFAIDMSAGGGVVVGSFTTKLSGFDDSIDQTNNDGMYGFFGFFDATYIQVSIGYDKVNSESEVGSIVFDFLGKYPFPMGKKFTVFPLAGLGYQKAVSVEEGIDEADVSHFYFKGGVGGDYAITEKLYARATGLYAYYLDNSFNKDFEDAGGGKLTTYGFEFSAAVGYKF